MKSEVNKKLYPFKNNCKVLKDGYSIHYIDEGSGPILLMLNGNPTWSFLNRNMILQLNSHFRCITPGLSGFGLSKHSNNFDFKAESHVKSMIEFNETIDQQ